VSLEVLELVAQPRVSTYALPTAGLDRIYGLKTPLYHANVEGGLQSTDDECCATLVPRPSGIVS
jgi:hypothetical protein